MTYDHKLISFQREADAKLLQDYLTSQGLQVIYHQHQGEYGHSLHLLDQQQLDKAQSLIQEFLQRPNDRKYQDAAWHYGQSTQTKLSLPNAGQFIQIPFTSLILFTCMLVFAFASLGWGLEIFSWLRIVPPGDNALGWELWRLLGPALFHFSLLHIVFNLLWWWVLGKEIEKKFGASALAILFLASAVISNLAQYWIAGPNFGGLSGVVYALFGFVWWIGWLRPDWGLGLPKNLVVFLLAWLVIGYADILWVKMANTAHTVGLISGCLIALALVKGSQTSSGKDI